MEAHYKDSPFYKHLISLEPGSKTDLRAGKINNPDAVILFFWLTGLYEVNIKTLADFSNDWRGSDTLAKNYFGSNQCGRIGVDFNSRILFGKPQRSWPKEHKPYWYRLADRKPVTMALTADGYLRLSALLKDMENVLPRPWH